MRILLRLKWPIPPKRTGVCRASRHRVPVISDAFRAERFDGCARRCFFRPTGGQKALGRTRTRCQTARAGFFDFLLHRKVFDLIHVRLHVLHGTEWPFCENFALDQTHRTFSPHRIGAPPPSSTFHRLRSFTGHLRRVGAAKVPARHWASDTKRVWTRVT